MDSIIYDASWHHIIWFLKDEGVNLLHVLVSIYFVAFRTQLTRMIMFIEPRYALHAWRRMINDMPLEMYSAYLKMQKRERYETNLHNLIITVIIVSSPDRVQHINYV